MEENESSITAAGKDLVLAAVKAFYAKKKCTALYEVNFWVPDYVYQEYYSYAAILDEFGDKISEFREEFLEQFPEEADDEKAWLEYLNDVDWGYDPDNVLYDGFEYIPQLTYIDFLHPQKYYAFHAEYYVHRKDLSGSKDFWVSLEDEEYIQLLADYIKDPGLTVASIKETRPDIYKKIFMEARNHGEDYEVSFVEVKQDAEAIMKTLK